MKCDVNRGGGGEWAELRGGMGGGRGVNVDDRSAVVVMIFCSLFLGTPWPFRVTDSSIVLTGSLIGKHALMHLYVGSFEKFTLVFYNISILTE